jgi:predicted nucleotidyltransferase component of viral defense system
MTEEYRNQVRLLLSVLPMVAKQKDLALKGGTALNFFWHDFPRLSVDIDLTYLPGVKWKLLNIRKMDQQKHRDMLNNLEEVLFKG